jgi:peptidoglycan/xylan/chitin deacetylase (PgdA/CDA1 family)
MGNIIFRLAQLVFFALSKNRLTILTYHRVAPEGQVTFQPALTTEQFEQQLIWIKRYFTVLTLAEAGALSEQGVLPTNAAVITIDDGYHDCFDCIYPLLVKHGLRASFFVTTAGLTAGQLWEESIAQAIIEAPLNLNELQFRTVSYPLNTYQQRLVCAQQIIEILKYSPLIEREKELQRLWRLAGTPPAAQQFLTEVQIREMAGKGMEFGAHTVNHPILALEQDNVALAEIVQSKQQLEAILQKQVVSFAYPNGQYGRDFSERHQAMVASAGFKYAVSTNAGSNSDLQQQALCLRRICPWPTSEGRFLYSLLNGSGTQYDAT